MSYYVKYYKSRLTFAKVIAEIKSVQYFFEIQSNYIKSYIAVIKTVA